MSVAVALLVVSFFALVVLLARHDDRREREVLHKQARREQRQKTPKKQATNWQRAYSLSKSPKPFAEWKDWMESRGYNPSDIIERSEFENQNR